MKSNRELATILFTDVSDFTSTMDTDENLAMDQISRHKEIVSRSIQSYNGKLIKDMGDGLFVNKQILNARKDLMMYIAIF